jgi:hypothetical protein
MSALNHPVSADVVGEPLLVAVVPGYHLDQSVSYSEEPSVKKY